MAIIKYSESELEVSPKTPEWVKKVEEPEAKSPEEMLADSEEDDKEVR